MEEFSIACNTLKVGYEYARRKVNIVLKDNGIFGKTLKDFIKPEPKIKVKKDIKQIKKEELPQIVITDRFK
jgi:hypothetical protein